MDINAVRIAIAEAAAEAVSDPPLTCFPYVPTEGPTPFAYVQLEAITYDKTFRRGLDALDFTLMVMVSTADDLAGQKLVDAYLNGSGDASIYAAIAAARGLPGESALGGLADDIWLIGTDGPPRWFEWGDGKKYYGCGLKVRVIGPGS